MLKIKPGVSLKNLTPQMTLAARIIEGVYTQYDTECWITSGNDGIHMEGSKHYRGEALDFRTKNIGKSWYTPEDTRERKLALVEDIKLALGGQMREFDVLLEGLGTDNEHLHVEYDPKEQA